MSDASLGLPAPQRTIAVAAVLGAMTLVVLDASVATIALPTIATDLGIAPALSVSIVTAYQVALVMALLPYGALAERYGYRRVFAGGVALFSLASVCAAMSTTLVWLVTARCLQGLGAAAVMALGVALLRFSVHHSWLGIVVGWNALAVALASAAGPSLGAFILSVGNWHWLYALNVPLGVCVLLATRALPKADTSPHRLDLFSIGLNASAFALFFLGAQIILARPGMAAVLFAAAGLSLWMLVRREKFKDSPLIPLDLLRGLSFRVSVVASVCCFTGQTAALVVLPFHLQHELHQTPLAAGLYLTVWPLSVALAASAAGRLADRTSTARLCAMGAICLGFGLMAAAVWSTQRNPWPFIPIAMVCGAGFGLFQVANNRNMFLSAPVTRSGAAGGMQGTARLTGQTAGAVIVALLFSLGPSAETSRIALVIAAIFTLLAGVASTLRVQVSSRAGP